MVERGANAGYAVGSPGNGSGFAGKVEAHHRPVVGLELAEEESATAADIEYRARRAVLERGPDKPNMIAKHETAVRLGELVGTIRFPFGEIPIRGGIVGAQLGCRGARIQPDEAALAALHHKKFLFRCVVEPVRGAEQRPYFP